jgi:hypothetical protein
VSGPLGRRPPSDWVHVERHALLAGPALTRPTPVVMGTLWPVEADTPVFDSRGTAWIRGPFSGRSRGGHAYCLEAHAMHDSTANWDWWNQVSEGICVSEGITRCAALLFRRRFQPRPLYDIAQLRDEFSDTPPEEGTSVRAGFDVWRTVGLVPARRGEDHWESASDVKERAPDATVKVKANRWATSAQEVLDALGTPGRDWVTVLNSWGRDGYPHRARMSADNLQWLIERDGEAGIPIF